MVVAYATGQTTTLMALYRTAGDLGASRSGGSHLGQPQNGSSQNGSSQNGDGRHAR